MTSDLLKQYATELAQLEKAPPAAIELPPLAAIAIVSLVQFASRHPSLVDNNLAKIAIDAAIQLQALFNPESTVYKVLELGWNPDADLPRISPPSGLSWAAFFATDDDDDDDDYVDDDEHNFSGNSQLSRQDYPDYYDLDEEEEEKYTNERAIALYGDNYGPVVKEKDPQLVEAIKNYFQREGIDLDDNESFDNYDGKPSSIDS